jgi:hypothetical protein
MYACDLNAPRKLKDQKVTGWAVDDQGDSVYMRYDDKGRLTSYSTFKNGIKNGIAKKFFENGNVEFEINYENGLKEGITRWFYKSGNLYRETIYENDEETGIQKKYYENGNLMAEIPYDHGRILPGLKEYTTSGKLKTIYPEFIIEPINKLAFENKYILRCYLKGKPKGTDYFRVMPFPGSAMDGLIQLDEVDGAGQIEFFLRPGDFIMEKVIFRAEHKTSLRNTYVVEKAYNLALDY